MSDADDNGTRLRVYHFGGQACVVSSHEEFAAWLWKGEGGFRFHTHDTLEAYVKAFCGRAQAFGFENIRCTPISGFVEDLVSSGLVSIEDIH